MRKWPIYILVTIVIFIVSLLGAGWSQRPIIDYKLEGLQNTIDFNYGTLEVSLEYRNRGNIDASLLLIIDVTNANITVDEIEPWIDYNETQVEFRVAATSHMEAYSSQEVKITPVGDHQNFTLAYRFEDNSNTLSINGLISRLFLEAHSYYPTLALYNKTGASTYEWVK